MITEDDDDTHICLKCHSTITGLDNYVAHRKSGCNNQSSDDSKTRTLSPLMPPDEQDFSLKADDFFSLLELQSSSKKSTLAVASSSKSNSGVLTRSKATAVIQASNLEQHLRELEHEENQMKLINAVNNISGNQIKKDETAQITYDAELEELNYEYEEEEEDSDIDCPNVPPRTHTGGKWKPTSPFHWSRPSSSHSNEERNDWNNPPPSHTGGKWKPTLSPHPRRISEGEDEDDKYAPPPDHTKGKWIPDKMEMDNQTTEEISPLRKSNGSVKYWCGPCNRLLASKIVYERHLGSELHYKKTIHEQEFDNSSELIDLKSKREFRDKGKRKIKKPNYFPSNINIKNKKSQIEKKNIRSKKYSVIKCNVCRSKVLLYLMGKHLISHYHCRKRNLLKSVAEQMVLDNIHSIVLQSPFQCSCCRFFCNEESDFLFHWRSLDHIIVSESIPGNFLCLFCKYETDHNEYMEAHLLSENHREVVSVINRSVPIIIKKIVPNKCSTCGLRFRYNVELRQHCLKFNHDLCNTSTDDYQERYSCSYCNLILKSQKALQKHLLKTHSKKYFYCSVCALTFQTENESNNHRRTLKHKYAVKKKYNQDTSRVCQYCFVRFPHILHLKEHLKKEHPDHYFSCSRCGLKFTLSQELSYHVKCHSCTFSSSSDSYLFHCKKCPYKTDSKGDYLFHYVLHDKPIPVHVSDSDASTSTSSTKPALMYKCPECDKCFKKSSLKCHIRKHTNEKPFKCHFCDVGYARKSNLNHHLNIKHADELNKRKQKGQLQENNQKTKQLSIEEKEQEEMNEKVQTIEKKNTEKKYLCSYCGKRFFQKYTLKQHNCVHTGKSYLCQQPGCVFKGRSTSEIQLHYSTHKNEKPYACSQCQFTTKTKAQLNRHLKVHKTDKIKKYNCPVCQFSTEMNAHLKRHIRIHTGAKPFKCPHCSYTCNNLENLRKHVLFTSKHQGKCIYICSLCETTSEGYGTNFAREFQAHLVLVHGDQYDNNSAKEATSKLVESVQEKQLEENMVSIEKQENENSSEIVLIASESTSNQRPSTSLDNELLSMAVNRDEIIFITDTDNATCWTMEGFYEVEDAETLHPFPTEETVLLQERFADEEQT